MENINDSTSDYMISSSCGNTSKWLDLRNVTTDIIDSNYFFSENEKFVILIFFPILMTFGTVGNVAFLVVVAKIPEMRTITNTYLANLAVCDLLFIGTMVYDIFVAYLQSPDLKSIPVNTSLGCGTLYGVLYIAHFTSLCIVVLVSFERYLAICHPLQHRVVAAKGRTYKLLIAAWIFGIFYTGLIVPAFAQLQISCVLWPESEKYNYAATVLKHCTAVHPFFYSFAYIMQTIPYITAVVFNSFVYYFIINRMHHRKIEGACNQTVREHKVENARNQVAKLLIINGTAFFLCYLPYFTFRINDAILSLSDGNFGFVFETELHGVLQWVTRGLSTTNSVINPLIYSATNNRYRRAFIAVFMCRTNRKNEKMNSRGSSVSLSEAVNKCKKCG
ncbi:galanin receptor 2a-like [Amphiura filiformis]|uniref:galanin receptor 2a-like n=1 Tax=Amphiura filiformis TaxID=82378 RepID=UPI003B226EF5